MWHSTVIVMSLCASRSSHEYRGVWRFWRLYRGPVLVERTESALSLVPKESSSIFTRVDITERPGFIGLIGPFLL